ncbi:MAG TPA: hypothetical protein VLN26_17265 [Gaiellaceae bacterium]|nr:hypothetical protein [Gaiellaceae bacterium]
MPDEWQESRHRIWAEPPDRHRDELDGPYRWISVRDGDRWLDWSPSTGLREERGASRSGGGWDVLDPAALLGGFRFERTGEGEVAGRRALLLRGRRRGSAFHGEIHPGIDEIALAVDAERGVLLRFAQLVDGEPCSLREVEEIAFDEEPPPGTFELVPPTGRSCRSGRSRPSRRSTPPSAPRRSASGSSIRCRRAGRCRPSTWALPRSSAWPSR